MNDNHRNDNSNNDIIGNDVSRRDNTPRQAAAPADKYAPPEPQHQPSDAYAPPEQRRQPADAYTPPEPRRQPADKYASPEQRRQPADAFPQQTRPQMRPQMPPQMRPQMRQHQMRSLEMQRPIEAQMRPQEQMMRIPMQPQIPLQAPARRQRGRGGRTALLVALCFILAVASGFAGGYFAERLRQTEFQAAAQPSGTISAPQSSPYASPPSDEGAAHEAVTPSILTNSPSKQVMTAPEAAAAVRQSVVEIKTETITSGGWYGDYVAEGAGSGVIISADGFIVTNNHVISGAESITVRLPDGPEYTARLIGTDVRTDIALIKIDATGLTPAVFGDSSALVVGESVLAVGNPLGELGGTVTGGMISALDRDIAIDGEIMTLLQTDAAVNPGNSGGGLFNMRGELIGVVNAKSGGLNVEGLGFAIPSNTAKAVVDDISAYGYVRGRVDTGLELVDIQTSQAARIYRVNQAGLYIYSSSDERLYSGDRITALGGYDISNMADYNAAMKNRAVGDVISITVSRGNESLTFEITLAEWRP